MKCKTAFISTIRLTFTLLISACFNSHAWAQATVNDSILLETDADLIKPNTLATHPFGIHISRINHNFRIRTPEKYSFGFEVSSGNVMLPYVKAYELTDPADRRLAANAPWHVREYMFDLNTVPAKTKEFVADALIRTYRLNFGLSLSPNHELQLCVRANSIDGGRFPYSAITSDDFIEWFHSNIAGGEDPFSRRYYGYNHARIHYKDGNGKTLEMRGGDFAVQGVELDYSYYPKLKINKSHRIYLNLQAHLGFNASKYNPGADLGLSVSGIKKIVFDQKNIGTIGISPGLLRQGIARFGDHVDIINNPLLFSFEGLLNYKRRLQNGNAISYGLNFAMQTSYNKREESAYMVLTGLRRKTHWQQTIQHLYETLQGWSFILTYSVRNMSYYAYFRQDTELDNAPDVQTGFGIKYSVPK